MEDKIIKELQYLLKDSSDKLIIKDLSLFKSFFNLPNRTILADLGIITNKDLIYMSCKQAEAISNDKQLKEAVISYLAEVNKQYVYSFHDENFVIAPGQFAEIIRKDEPWFANREINVNLYPCNRLKIALKRVNVKTYGDIKNFLDYGISCEIPGIGLETYAKLVTIVVSDHRYLEENGLVDSLESYNPKTPVALFTEILEESYNYFRKKDIIEYKNKWDYQFDHLKDDLIFGLAREYGEERKDIILDPNFSDEPEYIDALIKQTGLSEEEIIEARTVLKAKFIASYVDEETISKEGSLAHKFYLRCYRLGKYEMAGFVGILNRYFPFYPDVFKIIGDAYPKIKELLDKINDFVYEQEISALHLIPRA